jgi:hypothetical protein
MTVSQSSLRSATSATFVRVLHASGPDQDREGKLAQEPSRFELPRCLEISGWDGRTRLDKDERKIVRRHLDKLE